MFSYATVEGSSPRSDVAARPNVAARPTRSYQDADEQTLLAGLLADEPAAWREFNARYSRLIYACISRVVTRFGSVVHTDAVAEIYSMLCLGLLSNDKAKLRTFEPERGSKLGTWLGLLATHTAYDYLRSVRRIPKCTDIEEAEYLSSDLPDPAEQALVRERAAIAASMLEGFSEKDREFVRLYYGEGLSPEAVAQSLRISIKTVYSKKHKIQRRLESLLAEPGLCAA